MISLIRIPPVALHPILLIVLLPLNGCAVAYYWQAAVGQMRIANGQEPVAEVLLRPDIPAAKRARLELSQQALAFAQDNLRLPVNGSYRAYYDTGQPYVVWNVFAAPEFSLTPRTWCFPVAGCIAYRGYFREAAARNYAKQLAAAGDDVFVGGITAYSTLGRFRDPLLNTMLNMPEDDFVELLFHELAHQRLYVLDDSAFNESFATAVGREGARRWRLAHDQPAGLQLRSADEQRVAVLQLLRATRARLKKLYASDLDPAAMREAKQRQLAELQQAYEQLGRTWQAAGLTGRPYGSLFARGFNNASLSAIATYDDYVPAFGELLRQCGRWLACFYARSARIAELDSNQRTAELRSLLDSAASRE